MKPKQDPTTIDVTRPSFAKASIRAESRFAKAASVANRVTPNPYNSTRWRRERLEHLRSAPWCRYCAEQGRRIPATIVDHIRPWRGNLELFWNRANWQSLCKTCHDGAKQRFEKSGYMVGSNAAGMPLDTQHHWNRP